MYGYAIVRTILSSGDVTLAACSALLVFSGLLQPLARSTVERVDRPRRRERRPEVSPEPIEGAPVTLTSIELALIAELSLGQARDHEAVAGDVTQRLETRQAAAEAALAWRERARILQLEAQRRSGQPMVPRRPARVAASIYAGPERRRQMRRRQARRGDLEAVLDAPGWPDRRSVPERRRRDRRRTELAPR